MIFSSTLILILILFLILMLVQVADMKNTVKKLRSQLKVTQRALEEVLERLDELRYRPRRGFGVLTLLLFDWCWGELIM